MCFNWAWAYCFSGRTRSPNWRSMNVTFEENGASLNATERSCRFMWILAVSFDLLHVWRWSCTIILQHADDGFSLLYQVTSSAQWLWDWSQRWLIPNVREGLGAAQSVMGYVEMLAFFHNKSTTDIALKKHLGRRVHIAVGVTQFQSHPLVINEMSSPHWAGDEWSTLATLASTKTCLEMIHLDDLIGYTWLL